MGAGPPARPGPGVVAAPGPPARQRPVLRCRTSTWAVVTPLARLRGVPPVLHARRTTAGGHPVFHPPCTAAGGPLVLHACCVLVLSCALRLSHDRSGVLTVFHTRCTTVLVYLPWFTHCTTVGSCLLFHTRRTSVGGSVPRFTPIEQLGATRKWVSRQLLHDCRPLTLVHCTTVGTSLPCAAPLRDCGLLPVVCQPCCATAGGSVLYVTPVAQLSAVSHTCCPPVGRSHLCFTPIA